MKFKKIDNSIQLREWLNSHNTSKVSLDTETCPSNIKYDSFKKDVVDFVERKISNLPKSQTSLIGYGVDEQIDMLRTKKLSSIDECNNWCEALAYRFGIKRFPINIKDYYVGGEKAALRYYYLDIEAIQIYNGKEGCYINFVNNQERKELINILKDWLKTEVKQLIIHNAPFDLSVLDKIGIPYQEIDHIFIYDTMVCDHLLDERRRHGLKFLAKELLNKEEHMPYTQARSYGISSEEWIKYACLDTVWTWDLYEYQKPLLEEQELKKLYIDIESPYQWTLVQMKVNGISVDIEKIKELRKICKQKIEETTISLLDMIKAKYELNFTENNLEIITDVNFNSSKQLIPIIESFGLKITEKTPRGAKSVGKATLDRLKGHPFIDKLKILKIATKLYNSYLSDEGQIIKNIDGDGKGRPNFNNVGTNTGRVASNGFNMQQLNKPAKEFPLSVREAFVAPLGYKMFTVDYSAQEVAVMAEISKDKTLVDSLNKGLDMHLTVANKFYKLNIPEEKLYKTHPEFNELKEKYDKIRTQAKVITFGLCYGKGAYGFSKDFQISEDEAQDLIDKYFEGMPGLKEAIEQSHNEIDEYGYTTYLSGRKRHFSKNELGYYDKRAYRQAFNSKIQGFSADMIRMASNKTYKLMKENKHWGLQQVATVHDENVYVVKEKYIKEATEKVKEAFETAVNFCVPTPADISIGDNYAQAK